MPASTEQGQKHAGSKTNRACHLNSQDGLPQPMAGQHAALRVAESSRRPEVATAPAGPDSQEAGVPQDLSGVWLKDKAASDSMDPACDVMELGRLMRMAIGLIKGVEIRAGPADFELDILSGVLWFKIRERYPMSGAPVQCSRRDMRKGTHTGRVQRTASGGITLEAQWGEPYGGTNKDHLYLQSPDVLHMDTVLAVHDRTVKYRTVYRRRK